MPPRQVKGNWLVALSSAVDKISEAPKQFNIWAAASVIGATLKNRVHIKHGLFDIYPNQYIVLVGPPGVGKGSAIHPAYDFPKRLNLINVISDRITAPRIIERLASGFPGQLQAGPTGAIAFTKDASAVLMSTELPTLLTSSDWMLQFLCDAWDKGEYYYDTKNAGSATVKGMCTSLIGACVPEYIRRLNKDAVAAVNGGFTARTIFVYAEERSKKLPWPKSMDDTQDGRTLIAALEHDLKHISTLSGRFRITDTARWNYEKFYATNIAREDDTDVVVHFKSRMHVHVLKLAMIFSVCERDDLTINDIDLHNSIMCLKHVLANLDKAFRGVGESDLAEGTAKVQSFIEKKGITTRSEILGALHRHVSPENLDRILSILTSINFCQAASVGGRYQYKHTGRNNVISTDPSQIRIN